MTISVVIPTIGRATLDRAIESVLRAGFPCIVINDGIEMTPPSEHPGLKYLKLGRNYGRLDGELWYGQIGFTTGTYLSETEFTMALGDDDEIIEGVSEAMVSKIASEPEIDMWIPGLRYNNGRIACVHVGGFYVGNISHTIYRTKILAYHPMYNRRNEYTPHQDWHHVERCVQEGWKINWLGFPCVAIRPSMHGDHGRGDT